MKVLLLVTLSLISCCSALIKVNPSSQQFVDEHGRVRIFHGVNAVYKVPPYYPITDHFDPQLSITEEDMQNLQSWGMNVVRLGVMWPGVQPSRGQIDYEYLNKMVTLVNQLYSYGIYTLIDLHQDLFSRYLCGEGAPDWALYLPEGTDAFPSPKDVTLEYEPDTGYPTVDSCLQLGFFDYYFTDAVGEAFESLYENRNDIRTEFLNFWTTVATTFANIEGVLGYEIINEPWVGNFLKDPTLLLPGIADSRFLAPLYEMAHDVIRQVDDTKLIFFEKATINAVGPTGFPGGPGGEAYNDRQVYSYHNYCGSVEEDGSPSSVFLCEIEQGIQLAQELLDFRLLGCGAFLTEFGAMAGNNEKTVDMINWILDAADSNLQSWAYWQFKSFHDFTTTSNAAESFYWDDGTLQSDKVIALTRPYPQAVAGTIKKISYSADSAKFTLVYTVNKDITEPTDIFINTALIYSNGVKVSVSPSDMATATVSGSHVYVLPTSRASSGKQITIKITPK